DELLRKEDPRLTRLSAATFIQCVGSRDEERPYCSRVCCNHTIRNALELKTRIPDLDVYVLYRDMRTYGVQEEAYRQAREKGVLFFRYEPDNEPRVEPDGEALAVHIVDHVLGRPLVLKTDLLCLAAATVAEENARLAQLYKLPLDRDGWFQEAHQKLRPVDFSMAGIFLCGMAHYPKSMEESIAQAQAAAAKALAYLTRDSVSLGGVISRIDPERCMGCGICRELCPYGAIDLDTVTGSARVTAALCKGCGACAAACPAEAPSLLGFTHGQIYAQIRSALAA
ncbi:MAG: CoB--CoM heterodisulfide reductase iron-sulfur subunit A family protein, partial [Bacteroidetes bacterium]